MFFAYIHRKFEDKVKRKMDNCDNKETTDPEWKIVWSYPANDKSFQIVEDADGFWGIIGKAEVRSGTESPVHFASKLHKARKCVEEGVWGHYCFLHISKKERLIALERTVHSNFDIFYIINDGFILVSDSFYEISGWIKIKLKEGVLPEYLLYRELIGPETLAEGVYRLMPREKLIIKKTKIIRRELRRFPKIDKSMERDKLIDGIRRYLMRFIETDIVQYGLVTNSLSGGKDSSLTQKMAQSLSAYKVRDVYSGSLRIENFPERNEDDYAISAAKAFLSHAHPVPVYEDEVINLARLSILYTGYPLTHFQSAWYSKMADEISKRYRYCYNSDGSDCLFGTEYMIRLYQIESLRRFDPFSMIALKALNKVPVKKISSIAGSFLEEVCDLNDAKSIREVLNKPGYVTDYHTIKRWFGMEAIRSLFEKRRKILTEYMPEDSRLCTRLSIAKMVAGVAPSISKWNMITRINGVTFLFPFANSDLVNLVISAPESLRFNCFRAKPLVDDLLKGVPTFLVKRPKKSFGVPLNHFVFSETVFGSRLKSLRLLETASLPYNMIFDLKKRRGNEYVMWSVLGLDIWNELFCE